MVEHRIGRSVAEWFVGAGDAVHIVGRREAVLNATAAEIGGTAVVGDLSSAQGVVDVASALPDSIDVLVNNAGGNTDFDSPDAPTDR